MGEDIGQIATAGLGLLTDEISMADRVAAQDWSDTPLGPAGHWPEALKVAVQIMLSSRFPMFIWWVPS